MTPNRKLLTSAIASFAGLMAIATASFAAGLLGNCGASRNIDLLSPPPPPLAGVLGGAAAGPPPPAVPPALTQVLPPTPPSTTALNPVAATALEALPTTPSLGGLPVNAQPLDDTAVLALIIATNANPSASDLSAGGVRSLAAEGDVLLPVFTQLAVSQADDALPSQSESTMLSKDLAPLERDLTKSGAPALAPVEREVAKSGVPLNPATALGSVPKL